MAHLGGVAAEYAVINAYADLGFQTLHARWRGQGGEIDLILKNDQCLVFVEVKAAKTHKGAAARISSRQIHRILTSAEQFLSQNPAVSSLTHRYDAALVDALGRVEILENALADFVIL